MLEFEDTEVVVLVLEFIEQEVEAFVCSICSDRDRKGEGMRLVLK